MKRRKEEKERADALAAAAARMKAEAEAEEEKRKQEAAAAAAEAPGTLPSATVPVVVSPSAGTAPPVALSSNRIKCTFNTKGFFFCNAPQVAFWRFLPPQWTPGRPPGRQDPAAPGHLGLAGGRGAWASW